MRTRGDQYQGNLEVGQKVHCILYGGKDGVISAIDGPQDPGSIRSLGGGCVMMGGRANIRVAFEDHVSVVPECIVRGVQWYISDEIESQGVINETIEKARLAREEGERKRKEFEETRTQRRADLPAAYPYLTPGTSNGAKNIRTELKRAFPTVKFSVTTARGTGSIRINWTDGPLQEDVQKITGKYQEGNFDGMNDIYEYNHENVFPDVFGGSRYVFENRHESAALILKVALEWGYNIPTGECDNMGCLPGLDWEHSQIIYRQARQTRT